MATRQEIVEYCKDIMFLCGLPDDEHWKLQDEMDYVNLLFSYAYENGFEATVTYGRTHNTITMFNDTYLDAIPFEKNSFIEAIYLIMLKIHTAPKKDNVVNLNDYRKTIS